MKWKTTKSDKYYNWYKWFAWYPVCIEDDAGDKTYYCLQVLYRKQSNSIEYNWIQRFLGLPGYVYRETIFDIIKNG